MTGSFSGGRTGSLVFGFASQFVFARYRRMPPLDEIPKGNTCHGVNRAVVETLLALGCGKAGQSILDIPCGHGVLVKVLRAFFPHAVIKGADLQPAPGVAADEVVAVDASRPFAIFTDRKFDAITAVSGIMEFHNTRQFFETCGEHLTPDGRLIVTNDNVFTVRDRLANLFFGRTRLFRLLVSSELATWKPIPTQCLVRMLQDAGFAIESMRYVSTKPSDWLLLPLAALIWPFQWAQLQAEKAALPEALRKMMFPFSALIYRHCVVVCRKRV
jgi:2-polyprenyl-3-methyl-5-hydroxy-6-metoxy-1,4-benzoquinol methylase